MFSHMNWWVILQPYQPYLNHEATQTGFYIFALISKCVSQIHIQWNKIAGKITPLRVLGILFVLYLFRFNKYNNSILCWPETLYMFLTSCRRVRNEVAKIQNNELSTYDLHNIICIWTHWIYWIFIMKCYDVHLCVRPQDVFFMNL